MFPVVFDDGSHKEICSRNEILSPQSDGSASKPPEVVEFFLMPVPPRNNKADESGDCQRVTSMICGVPPVLFLGLETILTIYLP